MPITEQLVGKTAIERAQIKAEAIKAKVDEAIVAALKLKRPYSFTLADGRVVTVEAARLGPAPENGSAPVWLQLSVDGAYLNGDGWYGFVNPPILVPDGTGGWVEDLLTAAKTIVAHAVGGEV